MIYPSHGYADIFNNELRQGNNNITLLTKSADIILQNHQGNNYNSKEFVDKILERILIHISKEGSEYKKIQLNKSFLNLMPKNQVYKSGSYISHKLEIKLHPSEDTAHIFIDELNIIAAFKNEISCTKGTFIIKRHIVLEEDCSRLITIPEHGLQISLNHCSSYRNFKKILSNALYEDISNLMAEEFKRISLDKWNVELNNTNLDIKNIINDNMKILIA